jgi:carboxypeptidase C (cathepsin A)
MKKIIVTASAALIVVAGVASGVDARGAEAAKPAAPAVSAPSSAASAPASTAGTAAPAAAATSPPPTAAAPPGPPSAPAIVARVDDKPVRFADLPPPRRFVTRHRAKIGGVAFSYTATAGETYIANASGHPIASFFSFAYVKDDPVDVKRPVLFLFNGGPGAASIWVHVGALGPKNVVGDRDVNPTNTPPFTLRDNPDSVLDVADLVFVDPVGTGFSHAVGNARDTDFAGVDVDADSVARFIERWLTDNGRWNSPKYLVGESYGTIRAAVLSRALLGGPFYTTFMRGITLDGIVLVGSAIDGGAKGGPGVGALTATDPDAAAGVALPGIATTAWYHGLVDRGARDLEQTYAAAREFGAHEYTDALRKLRAKELTADDQQRIATKLASFTGLPADAWLKAELRIPSGAYAKQALASRGLELGMYDSRYTLPAGGVGDPVADDPAMTQYVPGFVAAFHDVLRNELKVDMPYPYASIAFGYAFRWDFTHGGVPDDHTFAHDLATSMRRTPKLRVLVCSGHYDLVTPPAAAERAIARAGLPKERVTFRNYASGHMLYLGGTASQFANDVREFVRAGQR